MNENHLILIAKELSVPVMQVAATAKLLGDGATVPFIARYRKEATGSLDEVAIAAIRDGLERLKALDDRREAIKKSLAERNLLTDELSAAIAAAETAREARRHIPAIQAKAQNACYRRAGKGAGTARRLHFQQPVFGVLGKGRRIRLRRKGGSGRRGGARRRARHHRRSSERLRRRPPVNARLL